MIRLLSPLAYRVVPWKNGGGTTTDIAVDPDAAGWDTFNWRVSIADIRKSGPFSQFPGVERSIALLECPRGTEMALTIDGRKTPMPPHEFIDFSGDSVAHGDLYGEPVRDFNVMSRRGAVKHRRGWKTITAGEQFRLGGTDQRVVYVASGAADMTSAGAGRTVVAGESLLASGEETLVLRGGPEGAQLVWAVFSPA